MMKTLLFTMLCMAGALWAGAQTVDLHVQNRHACDVRFQILGGDCDNTQSVTYSRVYTSVAGMNSYWSLPAILWLGPPPPGIIGVRVYADYSGCTTFYTDIFIPSGGPMPLLGPPVFPICSPCPPINTFFETYCGQLLNYVMFF